MTSDSSVHCTWVEGTQEKVCRIKKQESRTIRMKDHCTHVPGSRNPELGFRGLNPGTLIHDTLCLQHILGVESCLAETGTLGPSAQESLGLFSALP